ncbi:hypothetical protein ACJIZ3_019994 [Penstemon smallii]|uniref:Uncharacterized protein n=1 Tax=Penstemon smallii TaxID=265156 RepID=A0ABD3SHM9_9LAMI
MEILIKQTRARFPSTRQENTEERGKKIPPQKTQSFGEKKRSQSWLRRQFSRQMSWDYDFSGSDYTAAVAAAAYAIQSVEESKTKDQKEKTFVPDKSLNKRKSEMETPPEQLKSALKSSDETRRKSFKDPDVKMPERIAGSAPPIKKKLSFADINETINRVPEEPKVEKARIISASVRKDDATKPGNFKADAWEREEMASVKARVANGSIHIQNKTVRIGKERIGPKQNATHSISVTGGSRSIPAQNESHQFHSCVGRPDSTQRVK